MKDKFTEIYNNESNENTALILMLGVLGEKLTEIIDLISKSNKLSSEILSRLTTAKNGSKKEIIIIEPLQIEDYMG